MSLADTAYARPNAPLPNRYGAMCTEIYDLDKPPGSLPDVPFWIDRLAGTDGPILEAGVGTGRLLIPLLEVGFQVEGFDGSPDMLATCDRHCAGRGLSPALRQARFQDFAYDHSFAAILVPVGTFNLIDDFAEALGVLRRFFDHLAPGGRLMIDLLPPGYLTGERPDIRTWTTPSGDLLRIEGRAVDIDLVRQRRVTHDRYERWRDGRLVESELEIMAFRVWGLKEFEMALAMAGFSQISVGADHQPGKRPGRSSRILNFEALRPA